MASPHPQTHAVGSNAQSITSLGDENRDDTGLSSSFSSSLHFGESPVAPNMPRNAPANLIFLAEFQDGHSLRQLWEAFNLLLVDTPLFIMEQGIRITRGSGEAIPNVVVDTIINGNEILNYHFDPKFANHPSADGSEALHVINLNASRFRENIKATFRKEGIRLYQYQGQEFVNVEFLGGNKSSDGGAVVPIINYEHYNYDIQGFNQPMNKPNCRVSLAAFCHSCTTIGKVKGSTHAILFCYPNGARLDNSARLDNNSGYAGDEAIPGMSVRHSKWGDCDDGSRQVINVPNGPRLFIQGGASSITPHQIRIPIAIVKALGKLSNLTNNGIVKIYCEDDRIARLMIKVNYYAELTIYLIDSSQK